MKDMGKEMAKFKKKNTCDLVSFLEGRKSIGCKWVFKKKCSLVESVYLSIKMTGYEGIFTSGGN